MRRSLREAASTCLLAARRRAQTPRLIARPKRSITCTARPPAATDATWRVLGAENERAVPSDLPSTPPLEGGERRHIKADELRRTMA